MNIHRLLYTPAVWLCVLLGMVATSCITDDEATPAFGEGAAGTANVIFNLQLPTQTLPGTRSAQTRTQEGDRVDNLWVLAFAPRWTGKPNESEKIEEALYYYVKAQKQSDQKWEAELQLLNGREQTFLVIANVKGVEDPTNEDSYNMEKELEERITQAIKDTTAFKYTSKAELMEKIFSGDPNAPKPLDAASSAVMCGQTESTIVYSGTGQELDVKLHRMTARLNFYVGDKEGSGIKGFTLQSIRLYNVMGFGKVMPLQMAPGFEEAVDTASLPDRMETSGFDIPIRHEDGKDTPLLYDVSNLTKVENMIYLYETGQPDRYKYDDTETEGTPEYFKLQRPCIIVGGKWEGADNPDDTRFWRIDFKTNPSDPTSYTDLLRNHSYSFTLVNVSNQGSESVYNALTSTAENDLEVDQLSMDDYAASNVAFDGKNFLSIEHKSYLISRLGSGEKLDRVFTQAITISPELKTWTAELIELDADGNELETSVKWISFSKDANKDLLSGGVDERSINFYVRPWDPVQEGSTRTALIRFTAGDLQIEATVVQDDNYEVRLELANYDSSGNKWRHIDGDQEVLRFDSTGTLLTPFDVEFFPEDVTLEWALMSDSIKMPVMTGKLAEDGRTGSWQITKGMEADDLTAAGRYPFADFEGTLMVVAKLGRITKTLSIPVRQTRYGVILDANDTYQPLSSTMSFMANSNFDWTAEFVNPNDNTNFFVKGVSPLTTGQKGWSDLILSTEDLSEIIDIRNADVIIKFTDPTKKYTTYKKIKFECGITIGGIQMEIIDMGLKNIYEIANWEWYKPATDAVLPDKRVGLFLAKRYGKEIFFDESTIAYSATMNSKGEFSKNWSGSISGKHWHTIWGVLAGNYGMGYGVDVCKPDGTVDERIYWYARIVAEASWNRGGLHYQIGAMNPCAAFIAPGWYSTDPQNAVLLGFGVVANFGNVSVWSNPSNWNRHFYHWSYTPWGNNDDYSAMCFPTSSTQDFNRAQRFDYLYWHEMRVQIDYNPNKTTAEAARAFQRQTYFLVPK